jgi:hypothetical protein
MITMPSSEELESDFVDLFPRKALLTPPTNPPTKLVPVGGDA